MNAPACRHAPAGAGLCDLYRQFAVVDRGDDEPVARRIFERDIDLFAVHLDILGTDLHLVLGVTDGHLPFRGRSPPVAALAAYSAFAGVFGPPTKPRAPPPPTGTP